MNPDELEPFKSPYEELKEVELVRANADVAKADKRLISSIHVTRGFTHIAIAQLFKRIADECRKHKWTYLEQRELELFTMRLLRSPVDMSDGAELRKAAFGNVTGGTEGGGSEEPRDPNVEPDSTIVEAGQANPVKLKRTGYRKRKERTEEKG
jgi:hypothetical protein